MEFSFQITHDDLVQAGILQRRWWRSAILMGGGGFIVILVVTLLPQRCCLTPALVAAKAVAAAIAGVLFALFPAIWIRFIVIPRTARRMVRNLPHFYSGCAASLDDDRLRLSSTHVQVTWLWSELKGFRENDAIYVICTPAVSAYVIPKRGPAEQREALDRILRQKLKKLS